MVWAVYSLHENNLTKVGVLMVSCGGKNNNCTHKKIANTFVISYQSLIDTYQTYIC